MNMWHENRFHFLFHFQNKKALFSFSPSKAFNYPFVRILVDLRKPKIVWVPKIKWFSFEEIPENDGSVWRSGKLIVLEPINTSVIFHETSSTISCLVVDLNDQNIWSKRHTRKSLKKNKIDFYFPTRSRFFSSSPCELFFLFFSTIKSSQWCHCNAFAILLKKLLKKLCFGYSSLIIFDFFMQKFISPFLRAFLLRAFYVSHRFFLSQKRRVINYEAIWETDSERKS